MRQKYKDHQYIEYSDFLQQFTQSAEICILNNISSARTYTEQQIANIKSGFLERIKEINQKLEGKLSSYEDLLSEQEKGEKEADKIIKDIEEKRKWLAKIEDRVNKILEC